MSEQIYKKIEDIAHRNDLTIDQMGELAAEIRDVITGVTPSNMFVSDLKERLEIKEAQASIIAGDVSTEIFNSIKESLRKAQEESEKTALARPSITPPPPIAPPVSPIEKAGNFNIIRQPSSYSPQYNHDTLDKDAVLHDLENIEKLKPQNANNFVEHLLTTPVSSPPAIPKKPAPPVTPRKDGVDPYREQV